MRQKLKSTETPKVKEYNDANVYFKKVILHHPFPSFIKHIVASQYI